MLNIKNVDIIRHHIPINDWTITHIYKNYVGDNGKDYYIFQLERTGGIASTTISLEKDATNAMWNIQTQVRTGMYELKGPSGTIHITIEDIKHLKTFVEKLKKVC